MENKIERFFEQELNNLKDVLILQNDNQLYLFNKYIIKQVNGRFEVELLDVYLNHSFNFEQSAITWCIYHFNKKHTHLKRIQQLDSSLTSLDLSIKIHLKMLKQGQDNEIIETKLQEEKRKKTILQKELEKLVNTSKKWQTMKFIEKMS